MQAQPQKEHQWLQQLVGEWTFEGEAIGPDQQAMRQTGTERVRSLGPKSWWRSSTCSQGCTSSMRAPVPVA